MSPDATSCIRYVIPSGSLSFVDDSGTAHSIQLSPLEAYFELGCTDDDYLKGVQPSTFTLPFSWTVTPAVFALSGATAVSWILLVLLVISHKRRPFLQLWAVLFLSGVTIVVLSYVTAIIENQYKNGYQDSILLSTMVVFSWRFRLLFSLSLFFLWCAHLQVVLRLFYKKREKNLIKIVGGMFILIDSTLWALVLLLSKSYTFPWGVEDSSPPELASSSNSMFDKDFASDSNIHYKDMYYPMYFPLLLTGVILQVILHLGYGYLILVYTYRKRRYAYQKKCGFLIVISMLSFLVPLPLLLCLVLVFHVFLWCSISILVAGAASTVVVWRWIDVIEYDEKEEQKLGVMGRQIYEGKDAREYDKMSGTGGGRGVVSVENKKGLNANPRQHPRVKVTEKIRSGSQIVKQLGKALLTTHTPDILVHKQISNMAEPDTSSSPSSPMSNPDTPELRFVGTTQVDLSSPSPSAAASPTKKYTYPVKRARSSQKKGSGAGSSDSRNNYSNSPLSAIHDVASTGDNSAQAEQASPEAFVVDSAVGSPEASSSGARAGHSDDLPQFSMIPGFSIEDYHDDKLPLPSHHEPPAA